MTVNDIERLFRDNYGAMYDAACRLVGDREAARDIVHDVFAELLSDGPAQVTAAYLMRGVRYACLNHLRSMSVRERIGGLYALDMEDDEDERWPDEHDVARLNEIVSRGLSEPNRRVLRLKFVERMTYREIAAELGISEVAVYKNLRHAMMVLRQNFNKNER